MVVPSYFTWRTYRFILPGPDDACALGQAMSRPWE